jgi:hypothetical protein
MRKILENRFSHLYAIKPATKRIDVAQCDVPAKHRIVIVDHLAMEEAHIGKEHLMEA